VRLVGRWSRLAGNFSVYSAQRTHPVEDRKMELPKQPHYATLVGTLVGLRFAHQLYVNGNGDILAHHRVRSSNSKILAIDFPAARSSDVRVASRIRHGSAWAVYVQGHFFGNVVDGQVSNQFELPFTGGMDRLRREGDGRVLRTVEVVGAAQIVIPHRDEVSTEAVSIVASTEVFAGSAGSY